MPEALGELPGTEQGGISHPCHSVSEELWVIDRKLNVVPRYCMARSRYYSKQLA